MQYGILAQGRHQSPEDAGQQYTDVGQQRAVVFHPFHIPNILEPDVADGGVRFRSLIDVILLLYESI